MPTRSIFFFIVPLFDEWLGRALGDPLPAETDVVLNFSGVHAFEVVGDFRPPFRCRREVEGTPVRRLSGSAVAEVFEGEGAVEVGGCGLGRERERTIRGSQRTRELIAIAGTSRCEMGDCKIGP